MPDTGDFERLDAPRGASLGWGDAFAALPQDAPDAGGWQRVQARLPAQAPASPTRWPLWLAAAASLLLAIAIPWRMRPQAPPGASVAPPMAAATGASAPDAPVAPAVAIPQPATRPGSLVDAGATAPAIALEGKPRRALPVAPSQRPIRTVAQPADERRLATAPDPSPAGLEPLYARSAQLESLLAMARDDRVSSGTSAALSDGLDAHLASIDAALIQPGLDDDQRTDLWQQRVDALQQLVGIETTNRLYAARGQRYDAALVSID
jgi:hypothetical protein